MQSVLDMRTRYPQSTLTDLYAPLTMPSGLRKVHRALDKAVERCYRQELFKDDMQRLKFLFERYQTLINLI